MIAALWVCPAGIAAADLSLRETSNVIWAIDEPWFGGFSGAEISDDGKHLTVISDKGSLVTADLTRDAGKITAIQLKSRKPMTYANGRSLHRTSGGDAEGLAMSSGGAAFVSFELRHRLAQLDLTSGKTQRLPDYAYFASFSKNGGLEALAIHPDGTLISLPENTPDHRADFPFYALRDGIWQTLATIPRRGPFLPVGADIDNQGRLYLLERTVGPLGFRSRIRRFDLNHPNWLEETLLTSKIGKYDNLEALTLWHDTSGATRLTLISDDNFLSVFKTQIVEFILTE